MKICLGIIVLSGSCAMAQPVIPIAYEIHAADDIRAFDEPSFLNENILGVGRSMSIDGDTLAVTRGQKRDPSNLDDPGGVLVYRRNTSGGWDLEARLKDSVVGNPGVSLFEGDHAFAWAVAVKGNTLVATAQQYPHYDSVTSVSPSILLDPYGVYGQKTRVGAAFVYTRPNATSTAWTLQQVIYGDDPVKQERFGNDVRFHEDRLLISCSREWVPGYSNAALSDAYAVCPNNQSMIYVYEQNGSGQWILQQQVIPPVDSGLPAPPRNSNVPDNIGCLFPPPFPSPTPDLSCCENAFPVLEMETRGETSRNIAVDGDWMVTCGHQEVSMFKYNHTTQQYELHSVLTTVDFPTWTGTNTAGLGTKVDIDGDLMVVGTKKGAVSNGSLLEGVISLFQYDQNLDLWINIDAIGGTELFANPIDATGYRLGHNVFVSGDLIVAASNSGGASGRIPQEYTSFLFDRTAGEMLLIGVSEDFGSGAPGTGPAILDDGNTILLADTRDIGLGLNPNRVRAISKCLYDLNSDGSLNHFDISLMVSMHATGDLAVDYAQPFGVLDIQDINHYVSLYSAGCP